VKWNWVYATKFRNKLERGKVDFSIYIEVTGEETSSKMNVPIVKGYINQMKSVFQMQMKRN
jgi:uncharacterized protein YicC (UPF0701 family)